MDKQHLIDEIRRTAEANGGVPLGRARFTNETGIKEWEWHGVYWSTWSEAVSEAGFASNDWNKAYDEAWLIETLIEFIRELGAYPTAAKIKIKSRQDPEFPAESTIRDRLGRKGECTKRLIEFCRVKGGLEDVIEICKPYALEPRDENPLSELRSNTTYGYVYLMKSGNFYKIGRSDSPGRREYDLGSHRPEGIETVHTIKTDDPEGIEAYWHSRFRDKRRRGEWFELSGDDVRAFKRWKRIF